MPAAVCGVAAMGNCASAPPKSDKSETKPNRAKKAFRLKIAITLPQFKSCLASAHGLVCVKQGRVPPAPVAHARNNPRVQPRPESAGLAKTQI